MQEYGRITIALPFINVMKVMTTGGFKKMTLEGVVSLECRRRAQGLIDSIILESPLPIPSKTAGSSLRDGDFSQA